MQHELVHPHGGRIITRDDGRRFHVGGRIAPAFPHAMKLHDPRYGINLAAWPTTPSSTSYGKAPAAQACLSDILGNDSLGCCTIADKFHRQALRQAAGGQPVYHPSLADVIAQYARDGGYVAGRPETDQGCDETVVMQNDVSMGVPAGAGAIDRPAGFLAVDVTNVALVRMAISAFVGASCCAGLPDAWINPFPSAPGWTWDVTPGGLVANPNNGHCFTIVDQNEKTLNGMSWAMPFELTYDALAAVGTLYIVVDRQILMVAAATAPDGLDWATLIADFDALGGAVPVPAPAPSAPTPAPAPSPAPTASSGPSLQQAAQAVIAAMEAAPAFLVNGQAAKIASDALAVLWSKL